MNTFYLILFISVGLFNISAAIFNWDWYFKSLSKQRHFFHKAPRTVMRLGFAVLGIFLLLFGIIVYS